MQIKATEGVDMPGHSSLRFVIDSRSSTPSAAHMLDTPSRALGNADHDRPARSDGISHSQPAPPQRGQGPCSIVARSLIAHSIARSRSSNRRLTSISSFWKNCASMPNSPCFRSSHRKRSAPRVNVNSSSPGCRVGGGGGL